MSATVFAADALLPGLSVIFGHDAELRVRDGKRHGESL